MTAPYGATTRGTPRFKTADEFLKALNADDSIPAPAKPSPVLATLTGAPVSRTPEPVKPAMPMTPTPAPAPTPRPAEPEPEPEPIVKPTKKTGDEPPTEAPRNPAPPDRTPTAAPREPVTTPSPPVAPTGDRTASPRDNAGDGTRTAQPRVRNARWSIRNLLTAMNRPGGYGQAFSGGTELPELESYLQQQQAMQSQKESRLQSLLGAQQTQPRAAGPRPR